ncbi:MAG: hypothetical protein PHS44_01410 [Candidatus Dojkabacteria bacterium]|nr:hypothetical protein [Candidatus Dojkabacteria bacterium]
MSTSKFPKLHKIQWSILKNMSTREMSRFNDLKPKDMDPKRFVYHLDRLKGFKLICHDKESGRYSLTDEGKMIIAHYEDLPSIENYIIQTYLLLYIKKNDKLLVVKRKHAPYLGFTGNPFANVGTDKYIKISAADNLSRLGLKGELSLNLIMEMIYQNEKKVVRTHGFVYVFYIENPEGESLTSNEEGELFWMAPRELLKVGKGYDNTKDIVEFFESHKFDRNSLRMISKSYSTPW